MMPPGQLARSGASDMVAGSFLLFCWAGVELHAENTPFNISVQDSASLIHSLMPLPYHQILLLASFLASLASHHQKLHFRVQLFTDTLGLQGNSRQLLPSLENKGMRNPIVVFAMTFRRTV
jgi:hypothetical protein